MSRADNDDPSTATASCSCGDCGAFNAAGAERCWLCGAPISAANAIAATAVSSDSATESSPFTASNSDGVTRPTRQGFQFSLATLMLTITLLAVCLGVAGLQPGLGILLLVLVSPAYVRSALAARRRRGRGQPMSPADKLIAFLGSLGIVTAIVIAMGAAFYLTCWVGFVGGAALGSAAGAKGYDPIGWGFVVGIGVGLVAGIVVGFFVIRWLWPFERKPRKRKQPAT